MVVADKAVFDDLPGRSVTAVQIVVLFGLPAEQLDGVLMALAVA